MARPKKWPPEMHPHPASGLERVRYNGKAYYLGPIGSVEAKLAYAKLIERLQAERQGQPLPDPPARKKTGLTVAELLRKWEVYAKTRYSKEGRESAQYRHALEPLLRLLATLPAAQFGAVHLDQVRDEMIRLRWRRKVINRRVIRIRTVWRWAERKGHVPEGRWAALRALAPIDPTDARVRQSLPRQACELRDFTRVCKYANPTVRAMLLVQWFSAARPGEVRTMKPREIERCKDGLWIFRPTNHKNAWRGLVREVILGPRAQKVLAPFLVNRKPDEYVFSASPYVNTLYVDCSYSQAVRRACVRAGGVDIFPYLARHSCRRRFTRGMSLDAARAALGHSSLETTNHYAAGQDLELAKEVARRMG